MFRESVIRSSVVCAYTSHDPGVKSTMLVWSSGLAVLIDRPTVRQPGVRGFARSLSIENIRLV